MKCRNSKELLHKMLSEYYSSAAAERQSSEHSWRSPFIT
jgi:hypothetical protein